MGRNAQRRRAVKEEKEAAELKEIIMLRMRKRVAAQKEAMALLRRNYLKALEEEGDPRAIAEFKATQMEELKDRGVYLNG